MCMGQAAGIAASLSAQQCMNPRDIQPAQVRETLRQQGAFLPD
jgi:hypothetical protein